MESPENLKLWLTGHTAALHPCPQAIRNSVVTLGNIQHCVKSVSEPRKARMKPPMPALSPVGIDISNFYGFRNTFQMLPENCVIGILSAVTHWIVATVPARVSPHLSVLCNAHCSSLLRLVCRQSVRSNPAHSYNRPVFMMKSLTLFVVVASLSLVSVSAIADEVRTWTSGNYKIEAKFIESTDGSVILEKPEGDRVTVPLSRLSQEDQAHVKVLLADPPKDSPFMELDDPVADNGPKKFAIDWTDAHNVTLSVGNHWNVELEESPQLDFKPRLAGLLGKKDFWQNSTGISVSVPTRRAAISYASSKPGSRNTKSRILMVDLATGRTLHNVTVDGSFSIRHLHPDGERIICERPTDKDKFGRSKGYTYETVTCEDGSLNVIDTWNPFDGTKAGPHKVRSMQFAADNKLVILDQEGRVGVFDFATRQPIMQTRIPRTSLSSISPDGKLLLWCGDSKVGMIDLEKQEAVANGPAPGMTSWVKAKFSPSGKRIAASSQKKLMIWDTESGDVLFEGGVPGIYLSRGLEFPDDDFVLLAKQYLFNWETKIKLWEYTGMASRICSHGHIFCVAGNSLVTAKLPHANALKMLQKTKEQSDLFVVRKGQALAIDVSKIAKKYREEVRTSLEQQIEKIGCSVAENAKVTVTASITGPVKIKLRSLQAGDFDFNQFTSFININYDGKSIWRASSSNTPSSLRTPRDKSYKQQLADAGAKPSLAFFRMTQLPEYLQKPAPGASPTAVRNRQAIGVSHIADAKR